MHELGLRLACSVEVSAARGLPALPLQTLVGDLRTDVFCASLQGCLLGGKGGYVVTSVSRMPGQGAEELGADFTRAGSVRFCVPKGVRVDHAW